jgi:hypothetical protein
LLLPPPWFDSMLFDLTKQFWPLDLTKQFDSTDVWFGPFGILEITSNFCQNLLFLLVQYFLVFTDTKPKVPKLIYLGTKHFWKPIGAEVARNRIYPNTERPGWIPSTTSCLMISSILVSKKTLFVDVVLNVELKI